MRIRMSGVRCQIVLRMFDIHEKLEVGQFVFTIAPLDYKVSSLLIPNYVVHFCRGCTVSSVKLIKNWFVEAYRVGLFKIPNPTDKYHQAFINRSEQVT